jgi:hypothetical protein
VGLLLTRHGVRLHLGSAYPVDGRYLLHLTPWLLAPVGVAWVALRYRVPPFFGAAAWAVALGLVGGGPAALAAPLTTRYEYLADVGRVGGDFVRDFTPHVATEAPLWTVQVAGHPPLATLAFAALDRIGLHGAGWAAALCILGGAAAAPAVLSTVRVLAGPERAEAARPFVTFAPAALWIATSADALFAGVAAAGICALAHACALGARSARARPEPRGAAPSLVASLLSPDAAGSGRADALALLGGVILGACLYLSYGLVLIAPLAVAAVLVQRRIRPLLVGVVGVGAVVLAFTLAGFWWLDGLHAVYVRMVTGGGYLDRPRAYFAVANWAALVLMVGPAVLAALPYARRDLRMAVLPAAALFALAVAVVSDLSKGEVERIYLPWAVWLLPLAGLLPAPSRRPWLAAQLGLALVIAATTELTW